MTSAAARETDPIGHTSMLGMIAKVGAGLVAAVAVAAVATVAATAVVAATVGTGGIGGAVAVAVVMSLIMHFGGNQLLGGITNFVNDAIDNFIPPVITGLIDQGSSDVFINGLPAARALSKGDDNRVLCKRHAPMPHQYLAEGSDSVFINGAPAHRKGDRTTCDAKTAGGSPDVFIGGGSRQTREIENEMPAWLQHVAIIATIAAALCTRNWKSIPGKLGCLALNMGIALGAEKLVTTVFGNPVHAATGVSPTGILEPLRDRRIGASG